MVFPLLCADKDRHILIMDIFIHYYFTSDWGFLDGSDAAGVLTRGVNCPLRRQRVDPFRNIFKIAGRPLGIRPNH
jgi:hypothetical protein